MTLIGVKWYVKHRSKLKPYDIIDKLHLFHLIYALCSVGLLAASTRDYTDIRLIPRYQGMRLLKTSSLMFELVAGHVYVDIIHFKLNRALGGGIRRHIYEKYHGSNLHEHKTTGVSHIRSRT